jgi:hypothetical protein
MLPASAALATARADKEGIRPSEEEHLNREEIRTGRVRGNT